jgi:flagellar export protein FliJ
MSRFRLAALLRLRLAERDQRRLELAKALRAVHILQQQQAEAAQEQTQWLAQVRALLARGPADLDAILARYRYAAVVRARQQQLAAQLAEVEKEAQRRREALVEADRHVRVLEKLADRQAAAQQRQTLRREGMRLDEAAIAGYLRRQEVRP